MVSARYGSALSSNWCQRHSLEASAREQAPQLMMASCNSCLIILATSSSRVRHCCKSAVSSLMSNDLSLVFVNTPSLPPAQKTKLGQLCGRRHASRCTCHITFSNCCSDPSSHCASAAEYRIVDRSADCITQSICLGL